MSAEEGAGRFGAALAGVMARLDWPLLEGLYCEGDAGGFFGEAQREALLDASLRLASDVAEQLPAGAAAASLYLGAAVAELAPILCEALVLGRSVRWINLAGPESAELARALARVERELGFELPRVETGGLDSVAPGSCSHLWIVSVLTDPERFPALHDLLYERHGGALATGRGDAQAERGQAARLLDSAFARLSPPALVSTTDEELPLVQAAAARAGLTLAIPGRARLSPIVGDPVRLCTATRAGRRSNRAHP